MCRQVIAALLLAASVHASIITLDSINIDGGARLLVTVSPKDVDGNDLPAQRVLLDTGSSGLAFCDSSLADRLKPLETQYYTCGLYGLGKYRTGFWGPFYKGGLHISSGDAQVSNAYYSVMKREVGMPCNSSSGVGGIFGIAFRSLDGASSEAPLWPSSGVGSCPPDTTDFVQPLMHYLNSKGGTEQIGIYWSGKLGDGAGQLYLDGDATSNSHYHADAAAEIGKAKLGEHGWYEINVQSFEYNGKSYSDFVCDQKTMCLMDTGTPTLMVPQAVYDAVSTNQAGDLAVTLEGAEGGSVQLKFDVKTLLDNQWLEGSVEGYVMLGLPMRAFYYVVMDISDSSLSFSPMAAYFKKQMNATVIV